MLFEVPYNFDEGLIPFYKKYASRINFLYLPPYKDDLDNTRTSIQTNIKGRCYMPLSREEYEHHLCMIVDAKLRFVVLWQVFDNIITNTQLDYYANLGTSGFIVANDKTANAIKKYNPNLLVVSSIIRCLRSNIDPKKLCVYDYVILYYNFNRSLNDLKQLNQIRDKIILMPNTLCNIDCPSMHHWFPSVNHPFVAEKDCCMNINTISRSGIILPEFLYLFDNYVGGYKLQGREYSTPTIKYLCHFYFMRTSYAGFLDPFLSKDMAYKLKELINMMSPEEYYNMASQSCNK